MRNKATRNWWYQIQSFKCCVLRCYFGCGELVPCGRTVVLVILRYQKVPWAKRYRYRQKLYRGTAIIPRYRTTLLRCLSAKAGSHSNEQYCHLLAVVTSRSRSLQRISVFLFFFRGNLARFSGQFLEITFLLNRSYVQTHLLVWTFKSFKTSRYCLLLLLILLLLNEHY